MSLNALAQNNVWAGLNSQAHTYLLHGRDARLQLCQLDARVLPVGPGAKRDAMNAPLTPGDTTKNFVLPLYTLELAVLASQGLKLGVGIGQFRLEPALLLQGGLVRDLGGGGGQKMSSRTLLNLEPAGQRSVLQDMAPT